MSIVNSPNLNALKADILAAISASQAAINSNTSGVVEAKATETQAAVAAKAAETQAAVAAKATETQVAVAAKATETQAAVAAKGVIKSIQRGAGLTMSGVGQTVTIAAVNVSKSVLIFNNRQILVTGGGSGSVSYTTPNNIGKLTGETEITVDASAYVNQGFTWQVVEYE